MQNHDVKMENIRLGLQIFEIMSWMIKKIFFLHVDDRILCPLLPQSSNAVQKAVTGLFWA
jgi:hypothetical protein